MNVGKINLQPDLEELAERIDIDDGRSEISMQVSDLKLEQEKIKLELEKIKLEQEKERLRRLQRNSNRRPVLYGGLICLIVLFYAGFFAIILNGPDIRPIHDLSESEVHLRAIELVLLGVIPTIIVAFVMKAIFSATEKKDDKTSEIKISDAVPIKLVAETLVKH